MAYENLSILGRDTYFNKPKKGAKAAYIALHGFSGEATKLYAGMDSPDSDEFYWVFGNGASIYPYYPQFKQWHPKGNADSAPDIAYLDAIIAELRGRDVERVILGGHSNGAMMAYLYAAMKPEVIQGLFCLSGFINDDVTEIKPGNLPIVHVHGVFDRTVRLEGLVPHIARMGGAGHDVDARLLMAGHDMPMLNAGGRVVDAIDAFVKVGAQ